MARRTFARGRSFVRPPKRTVMWIGSGVGLTTIVASSVQLISSLSAGALALRPFTIMRTRQEIWFDSDQLAANEDPQGDYGKIVVTETAAGVGATAVPDPSSIDGDPDSDWFVHQPVMVQFKTAGTIQAWQVIANQIRYTIDSKAMRKVGADDDIVSMFSETGGHGAELYTRGRMLIQLH